jgi:hypothetical protein
MIAMALLLVLIFAVFSDRHDYDVIYIYIPQTIGNVTTLTPHPIFEHRQDCHHCQTNRAGAR